MSTMTTRDFPLLKTHVPERAEAPVELIRKIEVDRLTVRYGRAG